MNRIVVFFAVMLCAALFGLHSFSAAPRQSFASEAFAAGPDGSTSSPLASSPQAAAPTPTPDPDSEAYQKEITRGVWREGKAVFSDIKLLDIFTKYARGYRPEQPIKYSHAIHVGKLKMECTYCHSGVNKSHYATIPAVETCMGCHKIVRTDRPEIKKLKQYYDEKRPIEWEPVNNLPEHAHFNHERHLKAGVGCQTCHGQINKMEVVEKVSSLKMGWCVSCHRERGVSIDCAVCHY